MANDHKDDGSFDDTDFEDLDPIEDDDLGDEAPADESFSDDAWDDEEAQIASDDGAHAADDDVALEDNTGGRAKKTFVQKNFGLIVAAVVVVFGGIVGLSMMGGDSTPPAAENESADALPIADNTMIDADASADLAETEAMPPMPAPINPGEDETARPDDTLTPMPMPGQTDDTELAALEIEEVPAAPVGKTALHGEKPFDFPAEEPDPALADDGAGETSPLEDTPSLPPAASEESQERNPAEKAADYANAQFRARAGLPAEKVSDNDSTTTKLSSQEERAAEQQPLVPDLKPELEAQKSEIAALQKKLGAQQEQAEQSANDLKSSLEQKNEEIASLQKSVKALEKELSAARSATAKSAEAVKAAKEAPPLIEAEQVEPEQTESEQTLGQEIASKEPPAEKKPVKSSSSGTSKQAEMAMTPAKDLIPASKPVSVRAAAWELKGASPGKAVLSSKTTGDTRNVAVGDTIQGLGKITAIARENGRWTVRGTQGIVVR